MRGGLFGSFAGGLDVTSPARPYIIARKDKTVPMEMWRIDSQGPPVQGMMMGHLIYGYEKKVGTPDQETVLLTQKPGSDLVSCWSIDLDNIIHPTGCLNDLALDRLIACGAGGEWKWRNSPRRRLTDAELEAYDQTKIMGAKWAPELNWQVTSGHMRGRLIEVDKKGNPV